MCFHFNPFILLVSNLKVDGNIKADIVTSDSHNVLKINALSSKGGKVKNISLVMRLSEKHVAVSGISCSGFSR